MNKAELVNEIAKTTGQTKLDVHNTVAAILHNLTTAMAKGDRVTLVGFGTFERRHRQARMGVNPQNPEQKLKIAAARVPVFRAGQELKSIVDGKKKLAALPKAMTDAPKKAAKAAPKAKAAKKAKPKKAVKAKAKTTKAKPRKAAVKKAAPKAKAKAKPAAKKKPVKKGRR
ncbi:MAG: HU family DNA-binding protein [Candidatus Obscuribacterales bacterium]|nr:HU family DNA-binding protein [Candidatus Obscuribacterales bacterium]